MNDHSVPTGDPVAQHSAAEGVREVAIGDIERAISFHLRGYDAQTNHLPPGADALADIYGHMLYYRTKTVRWDALSDEQRSHLEAAQTETSVRITTPESNEGVTTDETTVATNPKESS